MRAKRITVGSFVLAIGVALASSAAWACMATSDPYLATLQPDRGPAGTVTTVKGGQWKAEGPIQLTWTGNGGQDLATVSGPSFSVSVTIPDSSAGTYYVKATQGDQSRVTPFQVKVASTSGGETQPGDDTADSSSTSTSGNESSSGSGNTSTSASGGSGTTSSGGGTSTGTQSDSGTRSPQPATTGSGGMFIPEASDPATGGSRAAAVPGTRTATRTADVAARPATTPAATPAATAAEIAVAGEDSAAADVWSGFTQGPSDRRTPSLVEVGAPAGTTSELAMGAWLMSGGLVALFAGLAFGEVRRRRVIAQN